MSGENPRPGFAAKLNRAADLYEAIHEHSGAFIKEEIGYITVPQRIGTDEWDVLMWADDFPDNPQIGVLVGELVHDVRSALDHLVYALVVANEHDPGEHTQYPIYDSETLWIRDIEERDPERKPSPVAGLNAAQLDFIKKRQPYSLTKKKRAGHPLMKLLRMSNVDKHQTLHASAVQAHAPTYVRYEPEGYIAILQKSFTKSGTIVETHRELGRVKRRIIRHPPPGVQVQLRIRGVAEMVFSEAGKPTIASVDDLGKIIECAREIVIGLWPGAVPKELPEVSAERRQPPHDAPP